MSDWRQRTQLLIGETGIRQLEQAHVLVVGLGGVGSYAAEALVRAGVGKLTIVDGDEVDATNKNRQLQALDSSIGKNKAALLKERFSDINPQAEIIALSTFLEPDAFQALLQNDRFDYALDCIDSIQPKLNFIVLV
ncbi:MAG TPA: ThiF family adenylyltransferase, partial [Saprospiraceae bacterium]|nr:ThiF family adenylyltransferase [Saprospiraceae bacterium]